MENILSLHEVIVVVLITKPNRTATTDDITNDINRRVLYKKMDCSDVEAS